FTHISIRYNLEVFKKILKAKLNKLPPNLKIINLLRKVKEILISIQQEYRFIKLITKLIYNKY
ncbi:hypothetical protein K469DRAFT_578108, partial [Zopfia rhizophila CBS 207.26]